MRVQKAIATHTTKSMNYLSLKHQTKLSKMLKKLGLRLAHSICGIVLHDK